MQVNSAEEEGKLEKLAMYCAYGIGQRQAAAAVGWSEARVSLLMRDEQFIEKVQDKLREVATRMVDTNALYEKIEKKALDNVLQHVTIDSDPDLNMRAALMANRAVRRIGDNGIGMLDAQKENGGKMATINLSFNIQNKIMGGREMGKTVTIEQNGKDVNIATPAVVEKLLDGMNMSFGVRKHEEAIGMKSLTELLVRVE